MNTRPKLIVGGHCSVCGRDTGYCRCTVEDIHDWLEDQYVLPITPIEFGAANPIPVIGTLRFDRPRDGEADNLGATEVADLLRVMADDDDQLAGDWVAGTLTVPG